MSKLLLFTLMLLAFACEKNTPPTTDCIKVKIVGAICGEAVFQIQDETFYHLGENGWTNNGTAFDHVFHSTLSCTDLDYLSKLARPSLIGLELNVQILEEPTSDRNCAVCQATFANPPKTKQIIRFQFQGCE